MDGKGRQRGANIIRSQLKSSIIDLFRRRLTALTGLTGSFVPTAKKKGAFTRSLSESRIKQLTSLAYEFLAPLVKQKKMNLFHREFNAYRRGRGGRLPVKAKRGYSLLDLVLTRRYVDGEGKLNIAPMLFHPAPRRRSSVAILAARWARWKMDGDCFRNRVK